MRRLILVAAGLAVLATAGLAVGKGLDGTKSVKAVSGTFTAASSSSIETKTCTTADGKTIARSHGTYTGTAAGDPDLAGPITLDANSVINTTDGVGVVSGKLKIDVASGGDTVAHYDAVYDHRKVAGLASGHAQDPHAGLLANLSAGFSTAGGFTDGKLGGSAGGSAVELGPGKCEPTKAVKETSEARGTVSAISLTSITVAGLTCAVAGNLAAQVNAALNVGDRAEIHCSLVGGQNTLVKYRKTG